MTGYEYEYYCAQYLKNHGFTHVEVTSASNDQGIDVIAHKHNLKYGIQCKYYSGSVGNKAVQEAFAGAKYYGCDKAVVMTNSVFTSSAESLAAKTGVLLWSGMEQSSVPHMGKIRQKHALSKILCKIMGCIMLLAGVMTFSMLTSYPEHIIWDAFSGVITLFIGLFLFFASNNSWSLLISSCLWVIYSFIRNVFIFDRWIVFFHEFWIVPSIAIFRYVCLHWRELLECINEHVKDIRSEQLSTEAVHDGHQESSLLSDDDDFECPLPPISHSKISEEASQILEKAESNWEFLFLAQILSDDIAYYDTIKRNLDEDFLTDTPLNLPMPMNFMDYISGFVSALSQTTDLIETNVSSLDVQINELISSDMAPDLKAKKLIDFTHLLTEPYGGYIYIYVDAYSLDVPNECHNAVENMKAILFDLISQYQSLLEKFVTDLHSSVIKIQKGESECVHLKLKIGSNKIGQFSQDFKENFLNYSKITVSRL